VLTVIEANLKGLGNNCVSVAFEKKVSIKLIIRRILG